MKEEKETKVKKTIKIDEYIYAIMDIFGGTNFSFGEDIKNDAKKHNYVIAILLFLFRFFIALTLVFLVCKILNK